MKILSFILCTFILFNFFAYVHADESTSPDLSKNDILLIERILESTAHGAEFSVLVSLASVIINRYRSPIYPDSVLKIAEGSDILKIDHSVTPSGRSRIAVSYALLGSSPTKDATGVSFCSGEDTPEAAEYILIDGWLFYTE